MRRIILLIGWLSTIFTFAQTNSNRSLDAENPIYFEGGSIRYQGKRIELNERTFYLDGTLSEEEVNRYPFVFNSMQQAVMELQDGSEQEPMTLHIAPNLYWIDNPDDETIRIAMDARVPFGMVVKCDWLLMNGLTERAEHVVLASNRGQMAGAVGNFTMFSFVGNGLQIRNLTMGNYCNVDLEYPLNPSLNRPRRVKAFTQAQLAFASGDKIVARNVRFISRLNLCPIVGGKRTLFEDCYFESTDDALCGTGLYLNCEFQFYGSKPFYTTSETGAIFLNCDFRSHSSREQFFTKSENPVMAIDCRYHLKDRLYLGWNPNPSGNVKCYQSNLIANGQPVLLQRDAPWNTVSMEGKPILDAFRVQCEGKQIYNTYNLLAGDDDWDPMGIKEDILYAEQKLGRKLTNIPVYLAIRTNEKQLQTGKNQSLLELVTKRFQGYSEVVESCHWSLSEGGDSLVHLEHEFGVQNRATPVNESDFMGKVRITAISKEGLEASAILSVSPSILPAPVFTENPRLSLAKQGEINLLYALKLDGRPDQSVITWYRSSDSLGIEAIPVAVSRLDTPVQTYMLRAEDVGYYMIATIEPKHQRSELGESVKLLFPQMIATKDVTPRAVWEIDFQTFPTQYQPKLIDGFWTVDGFKPIDTKEHAWEPTPTDSWYYGTGFDAAKGVGLMQRNRGARLLYTPLEAIYGDMQISLVVDPCKPVGQGFGSSTGQYMDIYIKFDPITQSGYALRIVRTMKYHNAVDFLLLRYDHGVATPISDPVSTVCYKASCSIHLKVKGDRFIVTADTSAPLPESLEAPLQKHVYLTAKIEPNNFGGVGIQHTGSAGANATMLRKMDLIWE